MTAMTTSTAALAQELLVDERDVQTVVDLLADVEQQWRGVRWAAIPAELADEVRGILDPGGQRTAFARPRSRVGGLRAALQGRRRVAEAE